MPGLVQKVPEPWLFPTLLQRTLTRPKSNFQNILTFILYSQQEVMRKKEANILNLLVGIGCVVSGKKHSVGDVNQGGTASFEQPQCGPAWEMNLHEGSYFLAVSQHNRKTKEGEVRDLRGGQREVRDMKVTASPSKVIVRKGGRRGRSGGG
jgi:hypothetical protein